MEKLLDNPIYHALRSAHQPFAKGEEGVWYYEENVSVFAGLAANHMKEFEKLRQISPPDSMFVVFSRDALTFPDNWRLTSHIDMYQMVHTTQHVPAGDDEDFIVLNEEHIPEMAALVELTKPGPFRPGTIKFGNYIGIFEAGKLTAMAGHRFNPVPYTEISAVCTHPDHLGKGYAYRLMRELIRRILSKGETPFLHVRRDNEGAIRLYQKLGFAIRCEMTAYVIRKTNT